jgi:hypothetical protein
MTIRTDRRSIQAAALVGVIALIGPSRTAGGEVPHRSASTELRRLLDWLPEDTETLVAAQSFAIQRCSDPYVPEKAAARFMPTLAIGELIDDKLIEPLAGRKVLIAVNGMRLPQGIGPFGEFYAEGCSIVVFDRDPGRAAVAWTNGLRKNAKEVRKIAGREVFCFPSPKTKARRIENRKGAGIYLVRLAPDTILCATHDGYLQQLLHRVDTPQPVATRQPVGTPPGTRAFPDELPLWTAIDRSAPVWMIRRMTAKRTLQGVTFTWANDRVRIVYVPRDSSDKKDVLDDARSLWEARADSSDADAVRLSEALRRAVRCELDKQGRAIVSFKTDVRDDAVSFVLFLRLYRLQHED